MTGRGGDRAGVAWVLALLPLVLLAGGLSCDGPNVTGAIGFLPTTDGGQLTLVVAEDGAFTYGGLYEGDEVGSRMLAGDLALRTSEDGEDWSDPVPVTADDLRARVPDEVVDTWGPCLDGCEDDARWAAEGGPDVIPASRSFLLTRWRGVCGAPVQGVSDVAALPDGRTVVALGTEGVAVRDLDGSWDRHAVGGWEPTPVTLGEGLGVVRRIGPEALVPLLVAMLALWGVSVAARIRRWRVTGKAAPVLAVLAPVVIAAIGVVGILTLLVSGGGSGVRLGVAAGLVASVMGAVGAAAALPRLPRGHRVPLVRAALVGAAVGALLPLVWVAGVPGSAVPWVAVSALVPLVVLALPARRALTATTAAATATVADPPAHDGARDASDDVDGSVEEG